MLDRLQIKIIFSYSFNTNEPLLSSKSYFLIPSLQISKRSSFFHSMNRHFKLYVLFEYVISNVMCIILDFYKATRSIVVKNVVHPSGPLPDQERHGRVEHLLRRRQFRIDSDQDGRTSDGKTVKIGFG